MGDGEGEGLIPGEGDCGGGIGEWGALPGADPAGLGGIGWPGGPPGGPVGAAVEGGASGVEAMVLSRLQRDGFRVRNIS